MNFYVLVTKESTGDVAVPFFLFKSPHFQKGGDHIFYAVENPPFSTYFFSSIPALSLGVRSKQKSQSLQCKFGENFMAFLVGQWPLKRLVWSVDQHIH